jgi:glyoxylase-like metal-dependent hydrolase (beta-lactamase superfamily II)
MISLVEAGRGHTVDNIVVWLPQREVLFGGCLVKSTGSKSLGYTEDADLDEWPHTIDRVAGRFPGAKVIVPGHGAPGGHELLVRTKELLDARKK